MSEIVRRYTKTVQNNVKLHLINWNNNSKYVYNEIVYFARPQKIHRSHVIFNTEKKAMAYFMNQLGNLFENIEKDGEDETVVILPQDVNVISSTDQTQG